MLPNVYSGRNHNSFGFIASILFLIVKLYVNWLFPKRLRFFVDDGDPQTNHVRKTGKTDELHLRVW